MSVCSPHFSKPDLSRSMLGLLFLEAELDRARHTSAGYLFGESTLRVRRALRSTGAKTTSQHRLNWRIGNTYYTQYFSRFSKMVWQLPGWSKRWIRGKK